MLAPTESIERLDDSYWLLRAEVVPVDETEAALEAAGEQLLPCSHFYQVCAATLKFVVVVRAATLTFAVTLLATCAPRLPRFSDM